MNKTVRTTIHKAAWMVAALIMSALDGTAQTIPTAKLPDTAEEALRRLDTAIEQKKDTRHEWELRVDGVKDACAQATGGERITLLKHIYNMYARVQTDSALLYLRLIEQSDEFKSSENLQAYVNIARANTYAVSGLYYAATRLLNSVRSAHLDDELRLFYYQSCRTVYGWMADYAVNTEVSKQFTVLTQQYRDSIIACQQPGSGRDIVMADRLLVEGKAEEAVALLEKTIAEADEDLLPYICANFAEANRQLENRAEQKRFLAITATFDIQNGVNEYMALPILARLLYDDGDIERANTYLLCSMEDANYCRARLRVQEVSNVFPIIDKAYKLHTERQQKAERFFNIVLALLVVILVAVLFYLRRLMRQLASSRRQLARANNEQSALNTKLAALNAQLSEANEQMQSANLQLRDAHDGLQGANSLKEEYIAHYLGMCRNYLDTLEKFRRDLLRMTKSKQTDALLKALKDDELVADEQRRFYADFDRSFLNIHPNFVEKLNALLQPESKLEPRRGELLSTELRIFALIRLGISETADIAHFLNCSLTTIYNYRSRVRQNAIADKNSFEELVMQL